MYRCGSTGGGIFDPDHGFPVIRPEFQTAGTATPLRVRIYDDEERLLRDVTSSCNCLTIRPVIAIDGVYTSAVEAPGGTYTEVEGSTTNAVPAVCSTTVVESLNTPDRQYGQFLPRRAARVHLWRTSRARVSSSRLLLRSRGSVPSPSSPIARSRCLASTCSAACRVPRDARSRATAASPARLRSQVVSASSL